MYTKQLHDAFGQGEEALLDSALGALASLAANQRRHQVWWIQTGMKRTSSLD